MGFATIDNSKSVRSTNSIFAHKKDIGVTIEKMQKTKFKNFGVNGFCQMTAEHKSRHLFVPAALKLLRDASELGTSAARWADHRWSIGWRESTSRLHSFVDDVDALPPGLSSDNAGKFFWPKVNKLNKFTISAFVGGAG